MAPPRHSAVALSVRAVEKAGQRLACGGSRDGRQQQQSPPFSAVSRRVSKTTTAAGAAAVPPPIDDGESVRTAAGTERSSISPPSPLPLGEAKATGGMTASSGRVSKASPSRRRASWREQFASLRNDVADPWSATSDGDDDAAAAGTSSSTGRSNGSSNGSDGSSNGSDGTSSGAPTATLAMTKNGVLGATGEEEEVEGAESSLTATTTANKPGMHI